ncbi:hypothetical protein NHX12_002898 [Muraenolepis orangiensis]|uniref:Cytosolic fatty-acid binding proteins domain-containing protein n=1 Tax=Muraenolepis orangiensis TaxID=630683 RepID=A0A9Q0DZB1_9TELE|nr:hypothetical protein NHX12_002898 [Muraenolepis orangiensis]
MPNFAGIWKMRSSENFDELLKALGTWFRDMVQGHGSGTWFRDMVAGAAAAKPHVEIRQDGEQFYIKTSTAVRTTEISFTSVPVWETENKLHCKQTLVDGDGPKTFWSRELNGEELVLVSAECGPLMTNEEPLQGVRGQAGQIAGPGPGRTDRVGDQSGPGSLGGARAAPDKPGLRTHQKWAEHVEL